MESASRRRTDRVSLTIFLEVSGTDSRGQEFKESAETLLINRGGAVILFGRNVTEFPRHYFDPSTGAVRTALPQ